MAGTKKGGGLAAKTIRKKYGETFYIRIGQKGGSKSKNGGFASIKVGKDGLTGTQRAKLAGSIGGSKSKRTKSKEVKNIEVRILS